MSTKKEIDGKIEAEGELYLHDRFWQKLEEIISESPLFDSLIESLQKPEPLDWYDIRDYDLSEARTDERIDDFPDEADILLVLSYTGAASVKFDSPNADPFDLETYKKIKHTYTSVYLTNTAQSGDTIKILFGKGDWDITKTIPEIDLSGTVRNDYLDQITDPLKIGQIIKDSHIIPHADIAVEKILVSGTTRLDQWRSTEDYTYIAPGRILLKSATKLSDWQHPSDMTFIDGGRVYTGSITADKLTINDLADIKNLLTVAEGKILIGEDVLGTGLHGIKIVDEQAVPVTRLEMGHLASGIKNYGLNIRDENGTLWIQESNPQSLIKKIYDNELSNPATNLTISNLNGNTDLVYFLVTKIWNTIAGDTPNPELDLRINNDSGNNYGWQRIQGAGTTVSAARGDPASHIPLTYYTAANKIGFTFTWIFAKSGKVRQIISHQMYDVSGTYVGWYRALGGVWNNDADNITEINLLANKTDGIGPGSHIVMYKIGD